MSNRLKVLLDVGKRLQNEAVIIAFKYRTAAISFSALDKPEAPASAND